MIRTGWILTWIAVAIVALILAVALLITFFDWNSARPFLDERLSNAIGRPVAINGDLTAQWSRNPTTHGLSHWIPWPHLTARDITIANPAWAKQPDFATVRQVRFSLSPLGLISHTIDIPSVQVTGPAVHLERDAQGRDNWTFHFARHRPWKLDVGEVALGAGTVRIDDARQDMHLTVTVQPLGRAIPFDQIVPARNANAAAGPSPKSSEPYAFAWTAHGTWRGATARGHGKLGSVVALSNPSLKFPIEADLRLRDLRIALTGTLTDPVHLGSLDLDVWVSADSMSHLYPLTGVNLPTTGPFATHGRLVARMQQGFFEYRKFEGTAGHSDLQGTLAYSNAGAHPKLTGTLTSNELDFTDLAPLIGADSNAAKARRQAPEVQPAGKLLPVEKFDTARWRHMDADVTFFARRIVRKHALPIEDLSTRVLMRAGVLTLDPLKLGIAGGDLDARVTLDGRDDPMRAKAVLSVRGVQLKKLMPTVDLVHTSLGHINGDATLDGTGNSVAGILATSNGEVKLLIDNGMISKLLLEEAGLNLANIAKLKLFGDKPTRLNCAAADFIGRDGLWRSRLLVIDTQDMTIDVDGTVNLATGRLDFTLHPHNKDVRILSLRSPLYLHGTLGHPRAGVAKGPLVARSAAATALGTIAAPLAALATLVTPSHEHANACAGVLAAMRKPAQR